MIYGGVFRRIPRTRKNECPEAAESLRTRSVAPRFLTRDPARGVARGRPGGGEVASRPVRRILSRRFRRTVGGGHPSRPAVARRLQRPTRGCLRTGRPSPAWPCSRWGLPSRPGRPGRWCALTAPFHPYLCGAAPETGPAIGGLFSVALSCGSPRLGVTQHRARWSPDVPRAGAPKHPARGRPADSPPPPLSRSGGRAPMGIVAAHASP